MSTIGVVRLVVLVALAGCDVVWQVPLAHDAQPDTPAVDAAPDVETCFTFDEAVESDVVLISTPTTSRDQGHAAESIMNVGTAISSQGLLRYPAPVLAPGQRIAAVHWVGPFVPQAHVCGTGGLCGACAGLAHDGAYDVAYATSQWDEATACFNRPSTGATWQVIGAAGAMDRSAVAGHASYAKATDLAVELEPASAAAWIQNGRISVIVTPSASAVTVLPQHDFAVGDGSCNAGQPGTMLSFTVCQ